MKLHCQFALLCAAALCAGAPSPVHAQARLRLIRAQQRAQQRQIQRQQQQQQQQRQVQRQQQRAPDVPAGNASLAPQAFQRLQNMTPQQQERFLQNNQRFQTLPPAQQAQIRQRLEEWNKLTPNQQQELRVRNQIWEEMTPAQRRNVQQVLLPRWQALPAERQKAILQRLHTLRDMSEPERNAKLNDPAFMQGMNPEDQQMLRQFAHLHVGMAPDPPGN